MIQWFPYKKDKNGMKKQIMEKTGSTNTILTSMHSTNQAQTMSNVSI